ncbi:MAG: PBP1A family penicillin-binding protein [Myxococcota bacterium]|nr:PBP1A family penicillin-binding protein [Myxococcota bacterium]
MALKITCPYCSRRHELTEPYPLPGSDLHCWCGAALSISYPAGLMERLRKRGIRFQGDPELDSIDEEEIPSVEPDTARPMPTLPLPPRPAADEPLDAALPPRAAESSDLAAPTLLQGESVSKMPGLDAWNELKPGEGVPSAREPSSTATPLDEETVVMSQRQEALKLARENWDHKLSSSPTHETTSDLGGQAPNRRVPELNEPSFETTADMQERAPARLEPAASSEDTSDMGDAAPKKRPKLPDAPQGSGGGKPPFYRRKWFKVGLISAAVLGALGVLSIVGIFWFYGKNVKSVDELAVYQPATVTVIEDRHGRVIGEIYPVPDPEQAREERRYVRQIDEIPEHVQNAFIASEDANFWDHGGIDYMGIVRATLRNLAKGKKAQGASTITQQVARNFLLREHQDASGAFQKSIGRKIKEMVLARRMEKVYSKEFILFLYLNEIYFGSGAYGVEAASRVYFDKNVDEITIAEAAILAGLPQRPSEYSPHRNWDSARARQKYVINQMERKGLISEQEAQDALDENVTIVRSENPTRILAPHFTEHVRRHLVQTYGWEMVYQEGLVARTTCDLDHQTAAQQALIDGVHTADRSLGWRGPKKTLENQASIEAYLADAEKELREDTQFREDNARRSPLPERSALVVGELYEAVVLEVEKKHAVVGIGANRAMIPLSWSKWAYSPDPEKSWKYRAQNDLRNSLSRGDVVDVEVMNLSTDEVDNLRGYPPAEAGAFAAAALRQTPELDGALLAFDLNTGAVRSMVGGIDIRTSEFNRATQAVRQVGSTFKPVVYSAAIAERELTAGSMVLDAPLTYNTGMENLWKPGNYGEEYKGLISLRKALALSRNVCTVRVLDQIGLEVVWENAQRLGIESLLEGDKNLAMALGSSSLTMMDISRAYSVFATYGNKVEPYYIEEVRTRDGDILEEHTPTAFPEVMEPAVAGITSWLLQEVARSGTGAKSNQLGIQVAGKTGTTNDFKDAWFVGYSPDLLVSTWVGYDQPRSMGVSSTGGAMALPIWIEYLRAAYPKSIARNFPRIPDVVMVEIDETTGRVASGGRSMPFLPETVPTGPVVEIGQQSTEDLLTIEF